MLILWLTYLLFVGPLRGIPLLSAPGYVVAIISAQLLECQTGCISPQALRDVYAVLFIVIGGAWITSHPDIPSSRQSGFASLKSGTLRIFYALLAPEFVVIRALKEYVRAGRIADNYNADITHVTPPQWTHGFFVQMGGFVLHDTAAAPHTLSYEELRNLIEDKAIARLRVTEAEINDRSKGEFISRALVAFLTLSFAIKCATKIFNGIALSNVEIIMLVYAGLDAAAYMLWWSKPQNVGQAIPIELIYRNTYIDEKLTTDQKSAVHVLSG